MALWGFDVDGYVGGALGYSNPQFSKSWLSFGGKWSGRENETSSEWFHRCAESCSVWTYSCRGLADPLAGSIHFEYGEGCEVDCRWQQRRSRMENCVFHFCHTQHWAHHLGLFARRQIAAFSLACADSIY